jgi:alkane 1-monooxygenase
MYKRVTHYIGIFIVPIGALLSYFLGGYFSYFLPFLMFGLMPFAEQLMPKSTVNFTEEQEVKAIKDSFYDVLLYSLVPIHYITVFVGLYVLVYGNYNWETYEIVGKVFTIGFTCGVIGINLGHELGHRVKPFEMFLAKALLLTSLYMHFIIEHNHGHHKRVATDEDPASSRKGEISYLFWFRSMILGYASAWKIEATRLKRKKKKFFSFNNQMIWFSIIQTAFIGLIYLIFDLTGMYYFLMAALIGGLLLEAVNYLEHYGLRRSKKQGSDKYEKVLPVHSWNSNHHLGRIYLLELTRHSDHHYLARRKYQVLRHFDDSPQLPFGYPMAILVSLIPPLWFYIMNKELKKYEQRMLVAEVK